MIVYLYVLYGHTTKASYQHFWLWRPRRFEHTVRIRQHTEMWSKHTVVNTETKCNGLNIHGGYWKGSEKQLNPWLPWFYPTVYCLCMSKRLRQKKPGWELDVSAIPLQTLFHMLQTELGKRKGETERGREHWTYVKRLPLDTVSTRIRERETLGLPLINTQTHTHTCTHTYTQRITWCTYMKSYCSEGNS